MNRLHVARSKMYDFDIGNRLFVIGKPQGSDSTRIIDSRVGAANYYESSEFAQISIEFLEDGMSGGIVLNTNYEWVGIATKVHNRKDYGAAKMLKIGSILSWLKQKDIPHNLLVENPIIGSWRLVTAKMEGRSSKAHKISNNNYSISFQNSGQVSGLIDGLFRIDKRNISFKLITASKSICVPTEKLVVIKLNEKNSDRRGPIKKDQFVCARTYFSNYKHCSFRSFAAFRFGKSQSTKEDSAGGSKMLSMTCKSVESNSGLTLLFNSIE